MSKCAVSRDGVLLCVLVENGGETDPAKNHKEMRSCILLGKKLSFFWIDENRCWGWRFWRGEQHRICLCEMRRFRINRGDWFVVAMGRKISREENQSSSLKENLNELTSCGSMGPPR